MSAPLELLAQHGCFMSDDDEAEIDELVFAIVGSSLTFAVGDPTIDASHLAKRTCMCGERIDGFDEYHAHLVDIFTDPGEAP